MRTIRILLADDHVMLRQGTRELLEREEDLEVVAEAGDGEEAVQLAVSRHPDIAIMDIAMPRLNGIEATKQIKAQCPSTAVLVLTAYDDDQYVFALIEAGAAGYLLKDVPVDELIKAIRAVHAGESVLHPIVARKVLTRLARPPVERSTETDFGQLSEREAQVLRLAAKGMMNREIAQELVVSVRTVQVHLGNVFGKLQVGSRTEAVLHALREGWLTLDDTVRD
ncbi:MAG: response regulator transcription factor, partial [Chloroflexi bacterium]|nr:response regulator transcription factor [Chloroflexota bacterium]